MEKQNAVNRLKAFEGKLPYGAKTAIARKMGENKHNVQTVFRGLAGEDLTIKVYRFAKKLYPTETRLSREELASIKSQSL